jgi:hypothetical protein
MYFTGDPEGFLATDGVSLAGQMGVTSTAGLAGLAGGATTLLNGGSLMDAVKSGGMMYLGTQGIEALGGATPVGSSGGAPVAEGTFTPVSSIEKGFGDTFVPKAFAGSAVPTPQFIDASDTFANPIGANLSQNTATPLQAPIESASVQAPVGNTPASEYTGGFRGTVPNAKDVFGSNIGSGMGVNPSNYVSQAVTNTTPTSFFGGLKDKFMALPGYQQAGIGAAGLLALKGMAKNNTVAKPPDNRKIKYYGGNPYSGAGFMRETPALAASGGIVALANGGDVKGFAGNDGSAVFVSNGDNEGGGVYLTPSQMASYAGENSVYAPAIAALNTNAPAPVASAPTYASFTPTQIKQYFVDNPGANVALATQQFNADPAAVAAALGASSSMASVLAANNAANNAAATPTGIASLPATASTAPVSTTAPTSAFSNATLAAAGQTAAERSNAASLLNSFQNPTATQLTDFKKQPTATQNAQIQTAISAATTLYGGNNAQAQAAVAKLMDQWGINPDTVQSALGSSYTGPSVQSLYNTVDPTGSFFAVPNASNTPTAKDPTTIVDPNTVASSLGLKGTYKSLSDVATALGLPPGNYASMADITKAITALSVTPKTPVTPAPLTPTAPPVNLAPVVNLAPTTTTAPSLDKNGYYVPATAPTTTNNGQTYNAGYISNTANPTTAQGVGGSHAFVNPNGYISQAPAMPFRPIGGYGTLQAAKDAFTKAGGSLGYTSPKAQAVTTEDATQHYLDMLSGKTPMSKVPYTPTGEIAKPYYTSVMGMPENPKYTVSQPKIYDAASRRYVDNPNYDPAFSATADYVGDAQTGLSQKTKDFFAASGTKDPSIDTKTLDKAVATSNAATSEDGTPADFDSAAYLSAHPDVAAEVASGKLSSAYQHYLLYGAQGSKIKDPAYAYTKKAAGGGLMALAAGGMSGMNVGTLGGYSDGGRLLRGPGDGISDSIPATIGARNPQPARLADGEFVVPARIVSELGNGSTEAGARKLYQMMDRVQNARKKTTGKKQVASNPRAEQYLPA